MHVASATQREAQSALLVESLVRVFSAEPMTVKYPSACPSLLWLQALLLLKPGLNSQARQPP